MPDARFRATRVRDGIPLYTRNRDDFSPLRSLIDLKPIWE
jgi:hypothetical protein